MWKHRVTPITRQKDKVETAQYIIKLSARGMVFILYPNATTPPLWEEALLREVADFPYGADDDQVDTLAQLGNHWQPIIDAVLLMLGTGQTSSGFVSGVRVHLPHPFRRDDDAVPRVDGLCWVPNR